ncbi:MAG: hypothetical protein ACK55I_49660, partial [bacterium]
SVSLAFFFRIICVKSNVRDIQGLQEHAQLFTCHLQFLSEGRSGGMFLLEKIVVVQYFPQFNWNLPAL